MKSGTDKDNLHAIPARAQTCVSSKLIGKR